MDDGGNRKCENSVGKDVDGQGRKRQKVSGTDF
jgi:hypothetical protein